MTLKQAFIEWAAIPENMALAARSRCAVNSVLLKKHGDNDVRRFTEFAVRVLMQECKDPKTMKTQAASILVHVLNYAAKKGVCQKPEFDYTIAGTGKAKPTKEAHSKDPFAESVSEVVGEDASGEHSPEHPSGRDKFGQFTKGMKPWNTGGVGYFGGGRKPVPVCQLHPETLEVVANFENMGAAHDKTGIFNIRRALDDHKMSGGYYWCRQGEEKDFKSGYVRGPKTKTWSRKKGSKQTPAKPTRICSCAIKEIPVQERSRRKPTADKPAVVEERGNVMPDQTGQGSTTHAPLSIFSDAELRAELERRGWYGTLYQRLEFMANRQTNE